MIRSHERDITIRILTCSYFLLVWIYLRPTAGNWFRVGNQGERRRDVPFLRAGNGPRKNRRW